MKGKIVFKASFKLQWLYCIIPNRTMEGRKKDRMFFLNSFYYIISTWHESRYKNPSPNRYIIGILSKKRASFFSYGSIISQSQHMMLVGRIDSGTNLLTYFTKFHFSKILIILGRFAANEGDLVFAFSPSVVPRRMTECHPTMTGCQSTMMS